MGLLSFERVNILFNHVDLEASDLPHPTCQQHIVIDTVGKA
jgi:hypothetical protein